MKVTKFQLKLVALLAVSLVPAAVDATCGQCNQAHACLSENTFQVCFNGVRDNTTLTCPKEKPICTKYGVVCMMDNEMVQRGCGDVSRCAACVGNALYACTSLNTFGRCSDGAVTSGRTTCGINQVCSIKGAAGGKEPCVSRCQADDSDICDRVEENPSTTPRPGDTDTTTPSAGTDTTTPESSSSESTPPTSTTTPDPATDSTSTTTESSPTPIDPITTTTTSPEVDLYAFCDDKKTTGSFSIPDDTECTSYIYCFFRGKVWQGQIYNCPAAKPYFNANGFSCGTEKPTREGCNV